MKVFLHLPSIRASSLRTGRRRLKGVRDEGNWGRGQGREENGLFRVFLAFSLPICQACLSARNAYIFWIINFLWNGLHVFLHTSIKHPPPPLPLWTPLTSIERSIVLNYWPLSIFPYHIHNLKFRSSCSNLLFLKTRRAGRICFFLGGGEVAAAYSYYPVIHDVQTNRRHPRGEDKWPLINGPWPFKRGSAWTG